MEKNYLKQIDRDALLEELAENYNFIKRKITEGRIKNIAAEKVRVQYIKALIQITNSMNLILKDKELDLIKKELELLKELLNETNSVPIAINSNDEKIQLLVNKIEGKV